MVEPSNADLASSAWKIVEDGLAGGKLSPLIASGDLLPAQLKPSLLTLADLLLAPLPPLPSIASPAVALCFRRNEAAMAEFKLKSLGVPVGV